MVYEIISTIVLMIGLPLLLGRLISNVAGIFHKDKLASFSFSYVMGQVLMWAVFQLVSVPLILTKQKLVGVTVLWLIVIFAMIVFFVWRMHLTREDKKIEQRRIVWIGKNLVDSVCHFGGRANRISML